MAGTARDDGTPDDGGTGTDVAGPHVPGLPDVQAGGAAAAGDALAAGDPWLAADPWAGADPYALLTPFTLAETDDAAVAAGTGPAGPAPATVAVTAAPAPPGPAATDTAVTGIPAAAPGPPGPAATDTAVTGATTAEPGQAPAAQTVPLVPFIPFSAVSPLPPAVPVAGLDPGQFGLGAAARAAAAGAAGILGQDHRRGNARPARILFPGLTAGRWHLWWIRRVTAAVVAGVVVTVLAAWPLGLLAAALAAAADALYRTRTSSAFVPSVRAPSARRRTRRRLARLGSLGYLSLHARAIPGTDEVIDHLVVGPAGIYVVDSEVWDRRLPVRATRGGKLFHGPRDQRARLEHAQWEADQAARLIGASLGQQVAARPAVVIYGPTVPWIVVRIGGVDVFCGRRLRRYLRREAYGRNCLDERQVEAIHDVAAQVLPPAR